MKQLLFITLILAIFSCKKPTDDLDLYKDPVPVTFSFESSSNTLKTVHVELYGCGKDGKDAHLVASKDTFMTSGSVTLTQNRIPYVYAFVTFTINSQDFDIYSPSITAFNRAPMGVQKRGNSCGIDQFALNHEYVEFIL